MGMLRDKDKKRLAKLFGELPFEATLAMFTQEIECDYCRAVRELLEELSGLSKKIRLEVYDFVLDSDQVKKYGVNKIPAIVVMGDRDYGIRFYGVPAGYEFGALIESILDAGRRSHGLPPAVLAELAKVDRPVHMQVMVSPTCPYCSRAVRAAHRFAMASEFIRGDMVEMSEFPFLAVKYNVQSVPHTVVNETHAIIGALPEMDFAKALLETIGK